MVPSRAIHASSVDDARAVSDMCLDRAGRMAAKALSTSAVCRPAIGDARIVTSSSLYHYRVSNVKFAKSIPRFEPGSLADSELVR